MFSSNFFPTPKEVIDIMVNGLHLEGKTVLEPSAGRGDIVDALQELGASVIACENDKSLLKIVQSKCSVIEEDFLKLTSDKVSHIDFIIMNPPFDKGADHILHAYNIAPEGCKIVALCNYQTIKNPYSEGRKQLIEIINNFGSSENLGDCFSQADRKTGVEVALIRLDKPGESSNEFEGFFMEEEQEGETGPGLMSYNLVRDIVNRYVQSIKIFDAQLETAIRLSEMTGSFYSGEFGFQISRNGAPLARNEFKKGMQKAGWLWIFKKLNMEKYATKGLKEDINKFVEKQENVPFTMRNIYKMLEIVVATQGARIDKAILEVFDRVTSYHHDNRMGLEGWKTNSHYLLTRKFIMPSLTSIGWSGEVSTNYGNNFELVEDLVKALCHISGKNYDEMQSLYDFINNRFTATMNGKPMRDPSMPNRWLSWRSKPSYGVPEGAEVVENQIEWGKWFEWGFFKIRAYKKGTIHFEFLDEKVWGSFNARVSKLKGYPLPENKTQAAYQQKQNGRKPIKKKKVRKAVILETITL